MKYSGSCVTLQKQKITTICRCLEVPVWWVPLSHRDTCQHKLLFWVNGSENKRLGNSWQNFILLSKLGPLKQNMNTNFSEAVVAANWPGAQVRWITSLYNYPSDIGPQDIWHNLLSWNFKFLCMQNKKGKKAKIA